MDASGISRGIGAMVFTVAVVVLVIGFSFGSVLFYLADLNKNVESKEKVLYPVDYRIEVNDKKVDTIYIYKGE